MTEVLLYAWLFVAIVVKAVDSAAEWLTTHDVVFLSALLFGAFAFHVLNKWLIEMEQRLQLIESKLGIERQTVEEKKSAWGTLLIWFLIAVYLLGKSLQAEGVTFLGGVAMSLLMLLLCVLCAGFYINVAIRNSLRKKRERKEWLDKIFSKQAD